MSNYQCPTCGKVAWKEPCNHCGQQPDGDPEPEVTGDLDPYEH